MASAEYPTTQHPIQLLISQPFEKVGWLRQLHKVIHTQWQVFAFHSSPVQSLYLWLLVSVQSPTSGLHSHLYKTQQLPLTMEYRLASQSSTPSLGYRLQEVSGSPSSCVLPYCLAISKDRRPGFPSACPGFFRVFPIHF
jgi:hypothetical protein